MEVVREKSKTKPKKSRENKEQKKGTVPKEVPKPEHSEIKVDGACARLKNEQIRDCSIQTAFSQDDTKKILQTEATTSGHDIREIHEIKPELKDEDQDYRNKMLITENEPSVDNINQTCDNKTEMKNGNEFVHKTDNDTGDIVKDIIKEGPEKDAVELQKSKLTKEFDIKSEVVHEIQKETVDAHREESENDTEVKQKGDLTEEFNKHSEVIREIKNETVVVDKIKPENSAEVTQKEELKKVFELESEIVVDDDQLFGTATDQRLQKLESVVNDDTQAKPHTNAKLYPDITKQIEELQIELDQETAAAGQLIQSTAPQEVELIQDQQARLANQKAEQEKAEKAEMIQPLTVEQLNSLYHNRRLEANVDFIKKFVENELKRESPEFYEILLNYQRARKNLLQTEAALTSLEQRYKESEEELWITETKTATVKGVCGDNARCTKTMTYEQARLNHTALGQLTKTLADIKAEIDQNLCLHAYSALLSKLQVESYLHNVIAISPALYELPRNVPVYGCVSYLPNVAHQVERLKTCISILFYFHRTPVEDEEMLTNLRNWTERLVSPLLRIGTYEDHLFILNHVMRCPAGVGSWAAHFIQTPTIPNNEDLRPLMFGNACFDHVITALSTVLIPTCGRGDFLCQMQKMFSPNADKKSISWVMVDEDGEEDEDPQNAWLYLHENDVVAILRQFSLADIFRHIFFIVQSPYNDTYQYDIEKTGESTMYRVYAFCTCLVRLFGNGLQTYSMARYRQLNKRLGRLIRQTVQFLSDHWGNFRDSNQGLIAQKSMLCLQLEFDSFFLRAVDFIHTAQRLGSWQFIADMPFKNISKDTMWKLLWLLYQSYGQSVDVVHIPPVQECRAFVQDSSGLSQLTDVLQHIPASEGVYLLNTMTNMTESCSPSDLDLIETVTTSVFEVSYICPQTRDSCSKMGRELLSAVVRCHPFILSKLLQNVHDNIDKLGPMGLYLFKSLPFEAWLPSDPDLVILRQWLLNSSFGSHTHLLAQLILGNINWTRSQNGDRLMVPWKIHKQVAILIVEAYQIFIMGKHLGSVIMEGVKQMSAAVQQYSTPEQEFNGWCWDLLIKLSLHRSSLPSADQRLAEVFHQEVLDLNKDDALLPLVKGNKENNATACFVSLMLTKYGHYETEFLSNGIPLLQILVDQGLSKPVICVLNCVVPMFVDIQSHLLENSRFQIILNTLLQSDESYFKVVKGLLSYDFPGPITKLLVSMIMGQIHDAKTKNNDKMLPVIGLWVKLLMKWPKWYQDRNYCCVLDYLIAASFLHQPAMEGVLTIMQDFYKQFRNEEKSQGMVTSFVNWVTSGTYLPSFLEKTSCPEFPWLAYTVLCLEGNYEMETKLWDAIHRELTSSSKGSIEQALKKSKNKLKLEQAPTSSQLNLYRFAQQALDIPVEHPVAVLTWQRFFILFLGRLDTSAQLNTTPKGSVGEKFFFGMSYSSMRKKLKKRLKETSDWYLKCTADIYPNTDEERSKKDMYNTLARMYQTFELWIQEPLLHDTSLYLPSLPPQYMTDRLLVVFQKNMTPWLEFIDTTEIEAMVVTKAKEWTQSHTPEQVPVTAAEKKDVAMETGKARILSRLQRCEKPLPPPPVHPVSAPVPDVSPAILEDRTALLHLLQADMDMLRQHAGQFGSRMAKQETLDEKYIRLIPELYKNVPKEKAVKLECTSLINPLHKCSKPGSGVLKYDEKWNSPIHQRQADENRADYRQLMLTNKLPPPQNIVISAVHTENTITMLVKLYRSCTDDNKLKNINNIACTLFFRLGETIDENVQQYPPTQQFFSSCIDVLGQNFIQKDASQAEQLLQMAIERPELGGLLSPHFVPNINDRLFSSMYTMLLKTVQKKQLELAFMLLTKFDVIRWLVEYNPSRQEVKKLVESLGQALCMCGVDPDEQHRLVFGLYVGHEKMVLKHRFPLNIHEVLAALLQGSSVDKLSTTCWTTFHEICFYGNKEDEPTTEESQIYPEVFTDLSTEQITNIIQWLGHEFMQIRLNQKEAVTFGLYPKWRRYVPHLADLLRDLSKCLVHKMVPTLVEATTNQSIESLWRCIVEGYEPWLQVIYISKVAGMPWIEEDREPATIMVRAFKDVVGFAHFKTLEIRGKFYNDFLSLLWLYFATTLCKAEVNLSVISVLNMEFQQLPWKQFCPNIQVMETLAQLKESGNSLGFNLVADIVSVIEWPQVTAWYRQYHSAETNMRYEGCLFLLLIQACAEKKYIENPDMEKLLAQAESFKWQSLPQEVYKKSCSWFLHDSDSKCILQGRTSPEGLGLRLLKSASGFTTEISQVLTEDWSAKRLCYLHTVSALICQCTFLQDWQPASLKTLIVNLLTEIETVESAVLDVYTQHQECTDMVKEILTLLNNCNPDNQGPAVVMETWIEWLRDSPQTILLSPCIHAATRSVASLTYMVQIVELCIELTFIPGGQRKIADPWSSVLATLQVPELNLTDFFMVCLHESAFLLLHCYILQRLPLCQNLTEEQGLIETILDWIERTKPSAENESKLLLWWHKILDLIIRQLDFGRDVASCVTLLRKFVHKIQLFGEDRMSGGLLGAIGLGKKSLLTEKFRLCSRAVVAFISQQIISDMQVRINTSGPMSSLPAAKQDLATLLSLKTNKKYQPIRMEVETISDFVIDQSKCLRDVLFLVKTLRTCFYFDKAYLAVIDVIDM